MLEGLNAALHLVYSSLDFIISNAIISKHSKLFCYYYIIDLKPIDLFHDNLFKL